MFKLVKSEQTDKFPFVVRATDEGVECPDYRKIDKWCRSSFYREDWNTDELGWAFKTHDDALLLILTWS